MPFLANIVAFNVGWLTSVIGAAQQVPLAGPAIVLVVIALHLRYVSRPSRELMLILSCGLIGAFFDSILVAFGWVEYPSGMFLDSLAPYWIIGMWMLFATTLNVSMSFLKGRPILAMALGAISGPMSYVGGQKLGGITFLDPTAALVTLSIGWGIMMPALMVLASSLDGVSRPKEALAAAPEG